MHNEEFTRHVTFMINKSVKVLIYPKSEANSASVGFFLHTGALNENRKQAGIAHVLEHMMFKSSRTYTTAQISQQLSQLGANHNASTSWDQTNYRATVPYNNLENMIRLYADMLLHPLFRADELKTEKGAIIQEINMYKNKYDILVRQLSWQGLYGVSTNNRLRSHDFLIGTEESVNAVTSEDLHTRHNKHAPMTICIVGKVDVDRILKLLNDLFAKEWKGSAVSKDKCPPCETDSVTVHRATDQCHICETIDMSGIQYPDDRAVALDVLAQIYGAIGNSRVYNEIREKRGLAYNAQAYAPMYSWGSQLITYVGCDDKNKIMVQVILDDIQHKLMDKRVPERELEQAKNALIGDALISSDDIPYMMLVSGSIFDRNHGLVHDPHRYANAIRSITASDVQEMAKAVFSDAPKCMARVDPYGKIGEK